MSDDDRIKQADTPESLHQSTRAHPDPVGQASEQSEPAQPETWLEENTQDHRYDEHYQWCEHKRTHWPDSEESFLSYYDFGIAKDLGDPENSNHYKTKKDYSWVPSVLCDIFYSDLSPETKVNILDYFLGLLSEIIICDVSRHNSTVHVYRDFLIRTVAPTISRRSRKLDFLGKLDPADAHDTSRGCVNTMTEINLVREIRHQIYIHALS